MSEIDPYIRMLGALARCSFLPGCRDKQFIGSLMQKTLDENSKDYSEKQRAHVVRLVHKYRRQIPVAVIMVAQDVAENVWQDAVRTARKMDEKPSND